MFQPPRDRDAYASIRGYVYQIDRTVDRWLGLAAGQVLELERGEDIDLVGRLISGDGTSIEARLLEQIKHRETSITLRTVAALEGLANFHDHRLNNPGAELRFCFLTNAVAGCEQLNPFPNRVPGITLWDRLRTRQLGDPPRELLYRLTLLLGSFDQADLTALASVAPPVDRPRERLNELLGAWVQRDTDTRFAVSPLARPLGRSELAADVRTRCYRELAEVITRRRVMNPLEGERASAGWGTASP